MKKYKILAKLGEGAHGTVVEGVCIKTGQSVALKKIYTRRVRDCSKTNLPQREISCLKSLHHRNIVELRETFMETGGVVLVLELMVTDLAKVLQHDKLTESHVKAYMLMILEGVCYCHSKNIIHRDLKPANILISSQGILKLADFGLGISHEPDSGRPMSHQVASRWYRAIELLYGSIDYDYGVDIWAVGCIFGEMLTNGPLFPGNSDIEQLLYVLSVLGTPDNRNWPEVELLPDYNKIQIQPSPGKSLKAVYPDIGAAALNLLSKFLEYNCKRRITAKYAMNDTYFSNYPLPAAENVLPRYTKSPTETTDELFKDSLDFDVEVPLELYF